MLNSGGLGYEVEKNKRISHLLMDDLKLFAQDKGQLDQELEIVKMFSDEIRMEIGLDLVL
jgi:hypothetical protein